MRIGITGATGFIGSALAKAATERGHGIVVFTRNMDVAIPWAKEVRPILEEGDNAIDPVDLDALVHLAGENVMGYWTPAKKRRIRSSRVTLTRRIVESLKNCHDRPRTFICASGTGAYGHRGDEWLTESSARGKGFLADVCAEWEGAACRALPLGVRVVLLRTGMVLGRDGGAWPLLQRIFSHGLGSRLGNGRQWVPWIHLEDEVGIILEALENPAFNGPVNLAAPHPATNADLTRLIAELLNKPTFLPVPSFMLRMVMGELGHIVLDSARVKPQAALEHGYKFKYPELDHALAMCV
ncbi:MAG: TIGR01777 family oxidoreductase [Roseimicrobium sp.]